MGVPQNITDHVRSTLRTLGTPFTLKRAYMVGDVYRETFGYTPPHWRASIRHMLQDERDSGTLRFLGRGKYEYITQENDDMAKKRNWRARREAKIRAEGEARAKLRKDGVATAAVAKPVPIVTLDTVIGAATPERRFGAPKGGDRFDGMSVSDIRVAATIFLQSRSAVTLYPFAPLMTPDIFDRLIATKEQTGHADTYTIYPVMQAYIDRVAGQGYNRPIVPTKCDTYMRAMQMGTWRPDGNPTQCDWNGNRINGQHRGLACRRSGKPYAVSMSFGHDPDDYKTMDQGAVRRARDLFDQAGWPHANVVASTVTWLVRYLDRKFGSRDTPVSEDLLKRAVDLGQESIINAVKVGIRISKNLGNKIPAQYLAVAYWLARHESPEEADHFFERWAIGGTSEYPVQRAVYNYIRDRHAEHSKAVLDTIQVAAMIYTWNYFAEHGGGKGGMNYKSTEFKRRFGYVPKESPDPVVQKYSRTVAVRPTTQFRKPRRKSVGVPATMGQAAASAA